MRDRYIKLSLCLCCAVVLGCKDRAETNLAKTNLAQTVEADTVVITPPPQADTTTDEGQVPLNCPAMLVAHSNFSARESKQVLSFNFQENPDFKPADGDICKGDLKNLWPDLLRFEAQIEAHLPNIYGFHDIDRALKYFPKTEREFKIFVDDAANDAGLHEALDALDRATPEGGMEIDHKIIWFIIENEEAYFAQEHTPIIETTLSKYNLKMRPYETEKMGYCYHPYKICKAPNYDGTTPEESDYKLERLSPGFSWYQFQWPT